MNSRTKILLAGTAALAAVAATSLTAAAPVPLSELETSTHVHGLAVSRADPSKLLIATHHGLYIVGPEGMAELISEVQDFMGFSPHPNNPDVLYASGHPAGGGNLGFIASSDQGRTWQQVSPGVNGPVDFHQMMVSSADPNRIYGAYGAIQVSDDGGQTWAVAGPAPERLIDLAGSSASADKLFAATEIGLLVSVDGARTWTPVLEGAPVTMVEVAPDGAVYAFVFGQGLMRSDQEEPLELEPVNNSFGGGYIVHFAVDPSDPDRLFAATGDGEILHSSDGGVTWSEMVD
jgi:photosystem II stability/assembly factor-like uncharacterized protein